MRIDDRALIVSYADEIPQADIQVIAQRGASFLVRSADGWRGVIVNVEDGSVSRALPVRGLLAHGLWGAVVDSEKAAQAVALVKPK